MDFLDEYVFITVDQENKKDVKYVLRSVKRYLYRLGYKWVKKKIVRNYKLREDNLRMCGAYVQFMTEVNEDPTRWVVYKDERYIHKKYQHHDDSMLDPNDEQDMELNKIHKGRRF